MIKRCIGIFILFLLSPASAINPADAPGPADGANITIESDLANVSCNVNITIDVTEYNVSASWWINATPCISGLNVNATGTCNDTISANGSFTVNSSVEILASVNVSNPENVSEWARLDNFNIDCTAPEWVDYGKNRTIVHKNESISFWANWTDNVGLNYSWLWTNISGWANITQSMSGTQYNSTFNWSSSLDEILGVYEWRIYANDTSGNTNNTTIDPFQIWGWSNVTMNTTPGTYEWGGNITLICNVTDKDNNSAIQGYNVSFYNLTPSGGETYLGSNLTNETGIAILNWTTSSAPLGTYYPKCNITDNATLFYNASEYNEANISVTLQDTQRPQWASNLSANRTIVHKNESIEFRVYWTDNYGLNNTTLAWNATTSGAWANVSFNESISGTQNWSNFTNGSLADFLNVPLGIKGWRQYANDTSGNLNETDVFTFQLWGWANITNLTPANNSVEQGSIVTLTCRVRDKDNGSVVEGYNVSFYNDTSPTTFLGWNLTDSSGNATFYWDTSTFLGTHYPMCVLEPYNTTLFYNASEFDRDNTTITIIRYNIGISTPAGQPTGMNVNASYIISITNTGSTTDIFSLTVNNLDNAAVFWLNLSSITLSAGETGYVLLNVTDETPGTYNVTVRATSQGNSSIYNETSNITTTVLDTEPPSWYFPSSNVSTVHKNESIELRVYWQDNVALDNTTLSWNVSGQWTNVSFDESISGTQNWSNFTRGGYTDFLNEPLGIKGWRQYANDTSGNLNETDVFTFELWGWANITNETPPNNSVPHGSMITLTCRVRDRDNGTNITGYNVSFWNNSNFLGSNLTNDTGHATLVWDTSYEGAGIYYPSCRLEDYNATLLYNASEQKIDNTTIIIIDATPPWWFTPGKNLTILHKNESILFYANWTDNIALKNASLELNVSGAWQNVSAIWLGNISQNWSNFSWSPTVDQNLGVFGWRIYANDTNDTPNYNNTSIDTFQIWGWANITNLTPVNNSVEQGSTVMLRCRVRDKDNGSVLEGYNVSFYNDTSLTTFLDSNLTDSSGNATLYWDTSSAVLGTHYPTCVLEPNNTTLFYNASEFGRDNTTITIIRYNVEISTPAGQTTEINVNASYVISITNTGSVSDTFTLTINNPDNAGVAELNVSSISLASGETGQILLNVTDESAGLYNVTVRATSSGNSSVYNETGNITTDVIRYSVEISTPAGQTTEINVNASYVIDVTNTGSVTDTFTLTPNNLDNAAVAWLNLSSITLSSGETGYIMLNVTDESPGIYNVTVRATSQGNSSIYNETGNITTTTLDVKAPLIDLISPSNGSWTNSTAINYVFNATDDFSPTLNCTLYIENIESGSNSSVISGYVTTIQNDTVEGIQSWRINCTDEAGNENQSPIWTINVDRTDPSIILSSPENNSWTNSTTINYNFTPDDNLAPQLSCGLYVAGILRNSSIFPPGITAILQNDTEEGNIPWWVNCSDLADNTNQSPVWTINVDRTFPSIIILSPTYSTTYDEEIDVTVVVDGTGSPPKAVTIDGKNVTPDSLLGNVGTYSKKVGLDLGENNIVVNATDSAENKNNTTIFIKRNPLPTPAPAVAAGGGGAAAPEKTPTPAEIKIVKIEIIPTKVRVGESVTINVYVKNSGESSGKITVVLKIAGIEEESETVSVSGLETKIVTFTTAKEEIGTYDVEVNGQAGSFTVIPKVATLEKKTEEATIESIEEGTDKTIEFTRPDVSKITLNLKRALKNVRIIIQTLAEIPVETLKDVPGRLYTYFEIISNIKDEDINSVVIEFKVSKSWIEDARINKTRISLFRFDDGRWDPLNTILEREEPEHIFYKVRTDRLSIFAVAGEMEVEAPPPPFPRIPIDWTPVGVLTAALMVSVIVIIMIGGAVYREEISALFRRRKEV